MVGVRANSTCIMLDLQTRAVDRLPDGGTLVLQHVGLAPDMICCDLFYCNVFSAFCWVLKIWNIRKCMLWIT